MAGKGRFLFLGSEDACYVLDAGLVDKAGESNRFRVAGRCMSPFLEPGDELVLDNNPGAVRPGWIVTFRWNDRLLTHRAIKTSGDRFWARGDNSEGIQGPLGTEDLVGRVVAVVRNGRRTDLSTERQRLLGLARNYGMAWVRQIARKHPGLRRFVEVDLLASMTARSIQRRLLGALLGEVSVREVKEKTKILAGILSPTWPAEEKAVSWIERKLNRGQVRAFNAAYERHTEPVGSVVLIEDEYKSTGKIGYVGWLLVRLGFRGAGIGRKLLEEVDREARNSGMKLLWAEVMPDNTRSLGLFNSMGYQEMTSKELERWPKTLRRRLLPGRVVVAKQPG